MGLTIRELFLEPNLTVSKLFLITLPKKGSQLIIVLTVNEKFTAQLITDF